MLIVKKSCSAKIHNNYIEKENLIKMRILMLRLPDILQVHIVLSDITMVLGKKHAS